MRSWFLVIIAAVALSFIPVPARAATLTQILSGRFLVGATTSETVWYLDPGGRERVRSTTLTEIRTILRERAIKISLADLSRIPVAGTTTAGDVAFRRRMAGRFLVVPEHRNQAWYVDPRTKRRSLLGSGDAAIQFVRARALRLTDADLASIRTQVNIQLVQNDVATSRGTFRVTRFVFAWDEPGIRIATDTANTVDCARDCPVLSLLQYVERRQAVAGMHGTYFCPQDYSACSGKRNSYDFPVWNTFTSSWRNGERIKFTVQPIVAFDSSNRPFLYPHARDFRYEADFRARFSADSKAAGGNGVLQAAFSNGPTLMRNGVNVLKSTDLDTKQATVRGARGGLGWTGTTMMFFVASGATVTDLAAVAQALGLDNAVNLDGGGSTAMYRSGRYVLGPGRNLPNAILITRR